MARGKFLFTGEQKFHVRGVTYGPFAGDGNGSLPLNQKIIQRDFATMTQHGLNAIRTYTVPSRAFLDEAQAHGLRVMVGLPWAQHIAFLSDKGQTRAIEDSVRASVALCAGHPAILCYGIGNEIPSTIVRWHGRRPVEKFLEKLYWAAKGEDPSALVSYVNYPSTEYLRLPFADIFCFNVYLESPNNFKAYLSRLQNLAGTRPLILAEMGLDSRRNGLEKQAEVLEWQIRATASAGCAGSFLFAWTDEWHRGGNEILDWDFGLVTRNRKAKPALATATRALADTPFAATTSWPFISVIVCTYNGARTLRQCLTGLRKLEYPQFEIVVVDDGSRDNSAVIAREFGVVLISTENQGLSAARNTGLKAARGEIVAYIDDDAWPDPHWLNYLAVVFAETKHAAVGGPNIAPAGDGEIAECVVNAPGGPVHVLLSDTEAEHIPGCNMAFRRHCLEEIGGFDTRFRTAGDDVDVCWRVQEKGWTIGFAPAATVWHHRRNSIRAYWKQQQGYGKAEAQLERKWPEKYNAVGHIKWSGQMYGKGLTRMLLRRQRVYHGLWGTAPFQSLHESSPSLMTVLPTMPEWYLVIIALAGLSALAWCWPKLILATPLLMLAAGATFWQALLSASQASFASEPRSRARRLKCYALTTFLHLLQPLARLWGRVRSGLTAFRLRMPRAMILPFARNAAIWSEVWRSPDEALRFLANTLRRDGAVLVAGGDYDRWDLEVRGGTLGAARFFMTVEEHGSGKQLFRFRRWPRFAGEGVLAIVVFTVLTVGAAIEEYWLAYDILALVTLLLVGRTLFECACAMAAVQRALQRGFKEEE